MGECAGPFRRREPPRWPGFGAVDGARGSNDGSADRPSTDATLALPCRRPPPVVSERWLRAASGDARGCAVPVLASAGFVGRGGRGTTSAATSDARTLPMVIDESPNALALRRRRNDARRGRVDVDDAGAPPLVDSILAPTPGCDAASPSREGGTDSRTRMGSRCATDLAEWTVNAAAVPRGVGVAASRCCGSAASRSSSTAASSSSSSRICCFSRLATMVASAAAMRAYSVGGTEPTKSVPPGKPGTTAGTTVWRSPNMVRRPGPSRWGCGAVAAGNSATCSCTSAVPPLPLLVSRL